MDRHEGPAAMTLIRGDTITHRIVLTETDSGDPLDLAGKTVTVTSRKGGPSGAILYQHSITINGVGTVTAATGMALESTAAAGIIIETTTSTESAAFAKGDYKYDLEVRVSGSPDVVSTPIIGEAETVVADYTTPD